MFCSFYMILFVIHLDCWSLLKHIPPHNQVKLDGTAFPHHDRRGNITPEYWDFQFHFDHLVVMIQRPSSHLLPFPGTGPMVPPGSGTRVPAPLAPVEPEVEANEEQAWQMLKGEGRNRWRGTDTKMSGLVESVCINQYVGTVPHVFFQLL